MRWLKLLFFVAGIVGALGAQAAKQPEPVFPGLNGEWQGQAVQGVVDLPAADSPKWKPVRVPGFFNQVGTPWAGYHGYFWYKRNFVINDPVPADMPATLIVGAVDDEDETFINGTLVGKTNRQTNPSDSPKATRAYRIPEGLLKQGENVIAVRVNDLGGGGGIIGPVELAAGSPSELAGRIALAAIFSDGMVLQTGIPLPVWGTGQPGQIVTVVFSGQSKDALVDEKGMWRAVLDPLPVSKEPLRMTISSGHDVRTVSDILVGEVWICGGQSNMDFPINALVQQGGKPIKQMVEARDAADYPLIRQFEILKILSPAEPVKSMKGCWVACTPSTAGDFTAVGYFFALDLYKKLGVPIGLIKNAWGGTPVEAWMSRQALDATKYGRDALARAEEKHAEFKDKEGDYRKALEKWEEDRNAAVAAGNPVPNKPREVVDPYSRTYCPATLYNSQVYPLAPYAIRGAVWYQGESNSGNTNYYETFPAMIADWRKLWGQGDFPFYFVQLANYMAVKSQPDDSGWAIIRDAQLKTLQVTNTGMAVTFDLGEEKDIHPRNKQDVGSRLALWALARIYKQDVPAYSGPLYKSAEFKGGKAVIAFDAVGGGLAAGRRPDVWTAAVLDSDSPERFQICGEDRKWVWAQARITGKDTVEVSSPDVAQPAAVRYAWMDNPGPVALLYNKEGLPASPFQTDSVPTPRGPSSRQPQVPALATMTIPVDSPALFVPMNSAGPVSPERLWVDNPAVLSLDGRWAFECTRGSVVGEQFLCPDERAGLVTTSGQDLACGLWFYPGNRGWRVKGKWWPQTWTIDLGGEQEVRAMDLRFMDPSFVYHITIEGTADGKSWKPLLDVKEARDGSVDLPAGRYSGLRIVFHDARNSKGGGESAALNRVVIKVEQNGMIVPWKPVYKPSDDAFSGVRFDDSTWKQMPVPGNWEVEGFSKPTYVHPDDAVGLYRRWVEVPAHFAGKRILWHFDGISFGAELWVNGQKAGYRAGCFTATSVDITPLVKPGEKNLFALRVSKQTDETKFDVGDFWSLGGIQRSTSLVALPAQAVEDIRLVTRLDSGYRNATLEATVTVRGEPGRTAIVTGRLYEEKGVALALPEITATAVLDAAGQASVTLRRDVQAPRLWSAEKPNLYTLVVSVGDEHVQQRFGFRQIEFNDGVLQVNGRPIKLFGICRHEEWGDVGHALDEKRWRKDIELMKAANINAVRTSHYPPARRFLELCDQMGLYVIDEVPACWTPANDPALTPFWLKRTQATWSRDKNSPCVIAWNIGNESSFGESNLAAYKRMLELDPTRPALISCATIDKDPSLTMTDWHYCSLWGLKQSTTQRGKPVPVVVSEGPHTFCQRGDLIDDWGIKDFFGEALANQTETIWGLPTAFGGFIWEWQDQGLADKYPGKDQVDPVTAALVGTEADLGGSKDAVKGMISPADLRLRGNNHKGIVDPFRNPNPEYFNVYRAYAPVMIKAREVVLRDGQWTIPVENRHAFTDLSELTGSWQALALDKVIAEGPLSVSAAPGAVATICLSPIANAEEVRVRFSHPDGRVVLSTRLGVPGKAVNPPPPALPEGASVVLDQRDPLSTVVSAAGCELRLDAKTGRILSWRRGNEVLLNAGPDLTLGERREYRGGKMPEVERKPVPAVQSKKPAQFAAKSVKARKVEKDVLIEVSGTVGLVESPEPVADLDYVLAVGLNGSIGVTWKMTWRGVLSDAWELGLRLGAPAVMAESLRWSRRGQWSDYPPDHLGAETGCVNASDIRFRCTKRDTQWALFSGKGPTGITVLATETPLHARGLPGAEQVNLSLCSQVGPPRDYSGNLQEDRIIRLFPGKTFSGSFRLQPTPISR